MAEEGNPNNIQILGLQVDNYIRDSAALRQNVSGVSGAIVASSWTDVFQNMDLLRNHLLQHIAGPVLAHALPGDLPVAGASQPGGGVCVLLCTLHFTLCKLV
jgi:hypothetical protein